MRCSLVSDCCEDASKFAAKGHHAHFSRLSSVLSLGIDRIADLGGQNVAMMQTA